MLSFFDLARNALATRAPDPPVETTPPTIQRVAAKHAGHMADLPLLRFRPLARALQNVVPPVTTSLAMIVLNHSERLVMELDQRPAILLRSTGTGRSTPHRTT